MKVSKLLVGISAVALLASCGPATSESTTTNPDVPTTSDTTQSGGEQTSNSSSSEVDHEKYTIKVLNDNPQVNLKADKTKAAKGETVTIAVTLNDTNYKVTKVMADGKECTKVNDSTYTFIMPDHPVKVSCSVMVMNGDVSLQGGITAVFEKQGDIYVARNVKVTKDADFNFVVKDKQGNNKNLDITSFDRTKTFASIDFSNTLDYDLFIAGGCTYDFYYDVNNGNRPCYVKRVSVDALPTSDDDLQDLFLGRIRSMTSVLPDNLVSTTYVNGLAQEKYVWNAYSDNSSLATVYDRIDDSAMGYNYAAIKDGVLTMVDNYEAASNKAHQGNYNLVKDNIKFSGVYKIAEKDLDGNTNEEDEFLYNRNFVNPNVADLMVRTNLYDMATFEADIMRGYRVGFVIEDGVVQSNVDVKSNKNSDDTFNVVVNSSKTYDSTQDRGHQGGVEQTHYEYRINLSFTKEGALLNGEYIEKRFSDVDYNFNNNTWVTGDADSNFETGKTYNKISISNTYGDKLAGSAKFDASKYLISSIKNFKVNNETIKDSESENCLNVGDNVQEFLSFDFAPATALNAHQYKIINTSDNNVISGKDNRYIAHSNGNSTLTLGINNGLGVTSQINVKVGTSYLLRNIYLESRYNKYPGVTTSDTGVIYTGGVNKFGIDAKDSAHNKSVPLPLDIKGVWIESNLDMPVSFDFEEKVLIIDATNAIVTTNTKVKLRIDTSIYDLGWKKDPVVFTFDVLPGIDKDALIGTWTGIDPINKGIEVKFTNAKWDENSEGYNANRPYKGVIKCAEGNFAFAYGFDASKNVIEAAIPSETYQLSTLEFEFNSETNELKVTFVLVYFEDGGHKTVEVLGIDIGDGYYDGEVFTK